MSSDIERRLKKQGRNGFTVPAFVFFWHQCETDFLGCTYKQRGLWEFHPQAARAYRFEGCCPCLWIVSFQPFQAGSASGTGLSATDRPIKKTVPRKFRRTVRRREDLWKKSAVNHSLYFPANDQRHDKGHSGNGTAARKARSNPRRVLCLTAICGQPDRQSRRPDTSRHSFR